MSKIAVIIYGPPGAGKGTQANLLTLRKNFIHFDTGKYLEQLVHDPGLQNDETIKKERELFDNGILLTPSFVLDVISAKAEKIANADFNLVFSGSPRTLFEAFGDENHRGLIEILEKHYGKENIYPILLEIDPEISIQRNKFRWVCSVCSTGGLYGGENKTCFLCGGALRKRTVDNPAVFKTRIEEYRQRTEPILQELEKKNYTIIKIVAGALPFQIHEELLKYLA